MIEPTYTTFPNPADCETGGMSYRTYIATHMLAGMCASDHRAPDPAWAVKLADDLIAELNKKIELT